MKPRRKRGHFIILERDSFRCVYCGTSSQVDDSARLTIDHITPVTRGGSDRADNLVTACENCNSQKQGRPLKPESQSAMRQLARKRNKEAGIADGQIIVLGKTSAERRSRQRWESLNYYAFETWAAFMEEAHDLHGNYGPNHRSLEQIIALSKVCSLVVCALPDYARLTGDSEVADAVNALFDSMIQKLHAAAEENVHQLFGTTRDLSLRTQFMRRLIRLDQSASSAKIDTRDVQKVRDGRRVGDLLRQIKECRPNLDRLLTLAAEDSELRSLLADVTQQYLAHKMANPQLEDL